MSQETVHDETRCQYRLTYQVRPPSGCPVRESAGTVSELAVYRTGEDHQCELLVREEDGTVTAKQFTRSAADPCPYSVVVDHGVLPHCRPADADDEILLTVYVHEAPEAQFISEALDGIADEVELIDYDAMDSAESEWTARVDLGLLTEKRRAALRQALRENYYQTPSGTTIDEMAERAGISSSAFATRLRKAEREVFDQIRNSM
ncbi:helix-turn-helix domain-containing protein [Halodesulfurarchaeum sp.]|uniref:helix-turn-helix domain-containing protein n=1 Tax=Halodesulfurarchaeum sp. TaxID=1980530 RepID=UPI001BC4E9D5|nr:helix-turn-helix domain-containing protein [Halodesulfurarchaeum sp.]